MNKAFKITVTLLLLVAFPLLSWLFLKKGFDFQKDTFDSLEPLGEVGSISGVDMFEWEQVKGKVKFVFFVKEGQDAPEIIRLLEQLDAQYEKIPDWVGIVHVPNTTTFNPKLREGSKIQIVILNESQWSRLTQLYPVGREPSHQDIYLIDTENRIRKTYRANDETSVKDLVSNASLLFPREDKRR